MNVMFSRLWDLDDDASDKFEDIEGLPIGMVEQTQLGLVVRGFSLTGPVKRGELDQLVVDLTGAYRFSPIAEALFGVRITDLSTGVQLERPISGNQTELRGEDTFYDPIFGARLATPLDENEKWWLQAHGDIGGFGVGMDFTWQVMANVGWKPAQWVSIWGGYRVLGQDFENAGTREKFGANLTYFGPQFGVGFH